MGKQSADENQEIFYVTPENIRPAVDDNIVVVGEAIVRCDVCRALVVDEDLFCSNCGTETPEKGDLHAKEGATKRQKEVVQHHFSCESCGASMSYDAKAQNLRCPFCSSEKIKPEPDGTTLRAKYVVPFQLSRDEISQTLRKWMGSSFWRPSDLASESVITQIAPVYVPYWVFQAKTYTNWSADTSKVPIGARGEWMPITGKHHGEYPGILVGASSVLAPLETFSICPFNLSAGISAEGAELENYIVEQFRVQRKYARPLARTSIEQMEREACRKFILGRARNIKVNVKLHGISSEPVLLPIWILAYRYKGELYRFLANGQTGRHTGTAPKSWAKIAMVIGGILLTIMLIFMLIGGISALG